MAAQLIDSHCHLDFPGLAEQLPQVLASMRENGVAGALCIGVNMEDFPRVLALAEAHDHLFASVGLHPEYENVQEPDLQYLARMAAHPKVIAIGETGLDYYWQKDRPEWQRQRFRTHIRAALALGKPLVVHTRDAADDTLRLLEEEGADRVGGIMHCFTESWSVAERALDLGFHLSFSGIVTFRNAQQVKEVAARAPLDRLLVETDAPYLAPAPHRGKTNQPAYVRHVAEELARVRGIPFETVARATTDNFLALFPSAREIFRS
ncbi:TatD family hydrolase [Azovibrio restrictus]|uniref:TatD family hydrolase n=1 Tax=Azovibrio restrictus TaxID=146938 RepID=UPI0026EBAF07|nr:TatD family hydrolase [Azovibrio restrictus]